MLTGSYLLPPLLLKHERVRALHVFFMRSTHAAIHACIANARAVHKK